MGRHQQNDEGSDMAIMALCVEKKWKALSSGTLALRERRQAAVRRITRVKKAK